MKKSDCVGHTKFAVKIIDRKKMARQHNRIEELRFCAFLPSWHCKNTSTTSMKFASAYSYFLFKRDLVVNTKCIRRPS